jgi:alpha-D-ribose 1-methylphosphonate 5-triphosphate diphosphatase PhnM
MNPPKPVTIELEVTEFPTAREAVEHARRHGGRAIRLGGRNLVVRDQDAEWLATARVEFAYLCDHHGQIVTVPVND